ncbi:MAG: hypothetical protein Q7J54_02415 [Candidatus Woesearchaeota archaeon]|nr:hypothetical protein [Candidatus Woesearchaeota archaeon]
MKNLDLNKEHDRLNPKLILFCKRMIKKNPGKKRTILKILDTLTADSHFINHFSCPPHEVDATNWDKKYIVFTNGVFFIAVIRKQGEYAVELESCSFGRGGLRFPIKKQSESYSNVFKAIWRAFALKSNLEEEYFEKEERY